MFKLRLIYCGFLLIAFTTGLAISLGAVLRQLPAEFVPFPVYDANAVPMALVIVMCVWHNFIFVLTTTGDDPLGAIDFIGMILVAGIGAISFASFFAKYLVEGEYSAYAEYGVIYIIFGIFASFVVWVLLFYLPLIIRSKFFY
ncbi:MAG: hypothetical protein UT00_C0021G0003 [Parcubacteria group bacterium GW2011_GWA1_38_7]|nr:MAG: hypothetical protein UT00_C0021G0003 [Parcubacteria group bacterium GW2011_GWA1_38_7]